MDRYEELTRLIDKEIDSRRAELVNDTVRLVNIPSFREESLLGAPFGKGPKKVLDTVKKMGEQSGFSVLDYGVGVVSLALNDAPIDLGIWLHGDVVSAGEGWSFDPYQAVEYGDFIIGRGAADNKGQISAIFNLLKIFSDLGIELSYNPAMFVGSNEETGMADIIGLEGNPDAKGFLNVAAPPGLSLVPDGSFPLGYGGKGALTVRLKSRIRFENMRLFAGLADAPGNATVIAEGLEIPDTLQGCKVLRNGKYTTVTSYSEPRHGAHPDPSGNMITAICEPLCHCSSVGESNVKVLKFLKLLSLDTSGEALMIEKCDEAMGKTTVFLGKIEDADGYASPILNIRYPVGITYEEIVKNVTRVAEEWNFEVCEVTRGVDCYKVPCDTPAAKELIAAATEIYGEGKPFTSGGGTYAHRLPNAYVYGSASNRAPENFPKGRGSAHGSDESVSIPRLMMCMKAYARALLRLDKIMNKT